MSGMGGKRTFDMSVRSVLKACSGTGGEGGQWPAKAITRLILVERRFAGFEPEERDELRRQMAEELHASVSAMLPDDGAAMFRRSELKAKDVAGLQIGVLHLDHATSLREVIDEHDEGTPANASFSLKIRYNALRRSFIHDERP